MNETKIPSVSKADTLRFLYTRLRKGQHAAFTELAERYGTFFTASFRKKTFFVLTDPRWLRQVLVTHQRNYTKQAQFDRLGGVLGRGLFTADGSFWKRQRALIQPAYAPKQLALYAGAVEAHCQALAERLGAFASRDEVFDVYPQFVRLTLDVVMETILGSQSQAFHEEVHRDISIIINGLESASLHQRLLDVLPLLRYVPHLKRLLPHEQDGPHHDQAVSRLNAILYQMVAEKQQQLRDDASEQHRDVLSILIKARDEQREGMSDEQIRDELLIALVAGHETAAVALSWATVLLSQNPACAQALHSELSTVLQGEAPQLKHLAQLSYTKAVVQETLRLYPPLWRLIRTVAIADSLGGTLLPEGAMVVMVPYITQRLASYWPEPEAFRPERFLHGEIDAGRDVLSYFPFGAGPRVCIGQNFALNEMMLALATVWQRFELSLEPSTNLTMDAKATLRPRYPLHMKVKARPT